jgi:hypothetical protein
VRCGGGAGDEGAVEQLTQVAATAVLHERSVDRHVQGHPPRAVFGRGVHRASGAGDGRELRTQGQGQAVDIGGVGEVAVPGLAGIEQVVGEGRAELVELEADGLVAFLGGTDQAHAAELHVAQFIAEDALLRGIEGRPLRTVGQRLQRIIEYAALPEAHPGLDHLALHGVVRGAQIRGIAYAHQMSDHAPGEPQRLGAGGDAAEGAGPGRLGSGFEGIQLGVHGRDQLADRRLDMGGSDGGEIRKLIAQVQKRIHRCAQRWSRRDQGNE